MGRTPSTQMQPTMPQINDISQQSKRIIKSGKANVERAQTALQNSEQYHKFKNMSQDALQKIQNSDNIRGALQRGQAMGQAALQKIQNSNFVKGLNTKMQEKMNDIIKKINENIQMMKDDLKVETITDLAKILIKSGDSEAISVGNILIQEADSIKKEKILLTGGGKKYKSKKHSRTKKHRKSKKHNRTKKHRKSKKHSRTKKKSRKR